MERATKGAGRDKWGIGEKLRVPDMKPPKATKAKEILISKDIGCRLTQMLPLDDVVQNGVTTER
jgi:hypothetical protein